MPKHNDGKMEYRPTTVAFDDPTIATRVDVRNDDIKKPSLYVLYATLAHTEHTAQLSTVDGWSVHLTIASANASIPNKQTLMNQLHCLWHIHTAVVKFPI
jgi:hypothetical protein